MMHAFTFPNSSKKLSQKKPQQSAQRDNFIIALQPPASEHVTDQSFWTDVHTPLYVSW